MANSHTYLLVLYITISTLFNFPFACSTPLVALAVVATLTLPVRIAFATVALAWLINQFLGYGLLGYPITDTMSFVWGGIIGASALVALAACQFLSNKLPSTHYLLTTAILFAISFIAYQGSMFAMALAIGDSDGAFSLSIIGHVFATNAIAMPIYGATWIALSKFKQAAAQT